MIGLRRGTVVLCEHEPEWDAEAAGTIDRLKRILGKSATDMHHVGSTAISTIKAKPIIDIAVACDSFDDIMAKRAALEAEGFCYREKSSTDRQLLFACGSHYDHSDDRDMQTHFIHVVLTGSKEWHDYLDFLEYLNSHDDAAARYEQLKEQLSVLAAEDGNRNRYVDGKSEFVAEILRCAREK